MSSKSGNCSNLTRQEITYAVLTVDDNDKAFDNSLVNLSLYLLSYSFFGGVMLMLLYEGKSSRSYIPIRKAVEVSRCSVEEGVRLMNSYVPDKMKRNHVPQKQSCQDSTPRVLHEEIEIMEDECPDLRAAWHYLVSTNSKLCVDITREFLDAHKETCGYSCKSHGRDGS